MLSADTTGLLYVVLVVPNKKYDDIKPGITRQQRESLRDAAVDVFIDVIDLNAIGLLASVGPIRPAALEMSWFRGPFPGTSMGYRREETAETRTANRIVNLKLAARSN